MFKPLLFCVFSGILLWNSVWPEEFLLSQLVLGIRIWISHIPTDQPHRQPASNSRKTVSNPAPRPPSLLTDIFSAEPVPELQDATRSESSDRRTWSGGGGQPERVDALTDTRFPWGKSRFTRIKADVERGQARARRLNGDHTTERR